MKKSTHTPEYQRVLEKLVNMRKSAGLTQRQMAERLGREHSFVWRIEKGERRLDVLEFHWVCRCLGFDSERVFAELTKEFQRIQPIIYPEHTPARGKAAERRERQA